MPRVGIALAAYRPDRRYFEEQLASIVAQRYSNWFCVATLDSPLSELRNQPALAAYLGDDRFEWHENPEPLGHKGNFERAISLVVARGATAVATCDQDDVWYVDKLEVLVDALLASGSGALVHCDMHLLRDDGIDRETLWQQTHRAIDNIGCWQTLVSNKVTGCTMLFDAELARRFSVIPPSFQFHDHWYALVAACVGRVVAVHRVLGGYRQHANNVVGAERFSWHVSPAALKLSSEAGANRQRWLVLLQRRSDATAQGLSIASVGSRLLFARNDLGLGAVLLGLRYFISDPRLARYCLRIALGKLSWDRRRQ